MRKGKRAVEDKERKGKITVEDEEDDYISQHTRKKFTRRPFYVEEDKKIIEFVKICGEDNWHLIPLTGLDRTPSSCRLRWRKHLKPGLRKGNFSEDEEDLIQRIYNLVGRRWSIIAGRLPGRTDYEIRNHWPAIMRKKYLTIRELNIKMNQSFPQTGDASTSSAILPSSGDGILYPNDIGVALNIATDNTISQQNQPNQEPVNPSFDTYVGLDITTDNTVSQQHHPTTNPLIPIQENQPVPPPNAEMEPDPSSDLELDPTFDMELSPSFELCFDLDSPSFQMELENCILSSPTEPEPDSLLHVQQTPKPTVTIPSETNTLAHTPYKPVATPKPIFHQEMSVEQFLSSARNNLENRDSISQTLPSLGSRRKTRELSPGPQSSIIDSLAKDKSIEMMALLLHFGASYTDTV